MKLLLTPTVDLAWEWQGRALGALDRGDYAEFRAADRIARLFWSLRSRRVECRRADYSDLDWEPPYAE